MTTTTTEAPPANPFDTIGGPAVVRDLVDRFYDLMDGDPAYAGLRDMHAADLAPMRVSLTGFLTGWLGGPRDWFDQNPGKCVMSLHARLPIDTATAIQWTHAMARALAETGVDPALANQINEAFARMSAGMVRR